jgi:hypothetical protein
MDELDDALYRVWAIVGSVPKWSHRYRIDQFCKALQPKLPGKRAGKPWGTITDKYIKLEALEAYNDAPHRKKLAAEAAIYAKYGRKVSPELAAKNRLRMRKYLIEMLERTGVRTGIPSGAPSPTRPPKAGPRQPARSHQVRKILNF